MPRLSLSSRHIHPALLPFADAAAKFEAGVDEAGRGPMFGRVYAAAVVLPKDASFDHSRMCDSKRVSSRTQMRILAAYIQANCIAYAVEFVDEAEIDSTNISAANMTAMHAALRKVAATPVIAPAVATGEFVAAIDGNYFLPLILPGGAFLPARTEVGGDRTYSHIAAASILAKCARDDYIESLCNRYPDLDTRYGLRTNQGYGTKAHLAGIAKHGISQFHRRTFGACRTAELNAVAES